MAILRIDSFPSLFINVAQSPIDFQLSEMTDRKSPEIQGNQLPERLMGRAATNDTTQCY